MELRRLSYFVVLAEELNFRRAAERLHISQPGLSQQIRVLEADLGVTLLHRDHRQVSLTDAGRTLEAEAPVLLAQVEHVATLVRAAQQGVRGILRLVHSRSLIDDAPDRMIRRFRASHPDAEITVETAWTSRNLAMIRSGEADAAFVRLPVEPAQDMVVRELGNSELAAAIPSGHPLAHRRHVRREDLRDEAIVGFPRDQAPGYFDHIHATIWGGRQPTTIEPDPEHMLGAVAEGAGISVFDVRRALRLRPRGVVVRRFTPPLTAGFGLAWSPQRTSSLLSAFIAEVTEAASPR